MNDGLGLSVVHRSRAGEARRRHGSLSRGRGVVVVFETAAGFPVILAKSRNSIEVKNGSL